MECYETVRETRWGRYEGKVQEQSRTKPPTQDRQTNKQTKVKPKKESAAGIRIHCRQGLEQGIGTQTYVGQPGCYESQLPQLVARQEEARLLLLLFS